MRVSCQPIAQRILQKSLTDLTRNRSISMRAFQSLALYHELMPAKQLNENDSMKKVAFKELFHGRDDFGFENRNDQFNILTFNGKVKL
jgi:hypothetical protein